jgi:hypothetical protein
MLSDVTILVTTFLRPGFLRATLKDISANLPECKVSVASDDDDPAFPLSGVDWTVLPFDSGLTAKRNAAVSKATTKYALLGSDDYDFSKPFVREGIERMVVTLDDHPEVDVVVGTYNGMRYEGHLQFVPGEYIMEHRLRPSQPPMFLKPYPGWKIEMGINYFLARTEVLREVPWDERVRPIGGEHGDWFTDMKLANKVIVFVKDCNIEAKQAPEGESWAHPDYGKYRRRAQMGHEAMLKKHGIKDYWSYGQGPR